MGRLFALGDLHLSGVGDKPMDIFGDAWIDHADRMARNWDHLVGDEDTVLLPGDLSWGRTLDQARVDLNWIGERRGRKLLLKGNHDSWWKSAGKVRGALPDGCALLQNDAHLVGDRVVLGARGWTAPDDPIATERDRQLFSRELQRLRLSIADADSRHDTGLSRIAMLHFPPWIEGRDPTPVVELLRQARVELCVYGHLHGEDHRLGVEGLRDGIQFRLVAADAVDFTPVRLT